MTKIYEYNRMVLVQSQHKYSLRMNIIKYGNCLWAKFLRMMYYIWLTDKKLYISKLQRLHILCPIQNM